MSYSSTGVVVVCGDTVVRLACSYRAAGVDGDRRSRVTGPSLRVDDRLLDGQGASPRRNGQRARRAGSLAGQQKRTGVARDGSGWETGLRRELGL